MTEQTPSDRRRIENELIARKKNTGFKQVMKKYFRPLKGGTELPLEFNCECSDADCNAQVKLSIREYEAIHKRKDRFVLQKDHQTSRIEKTIAEGGSYTIVEKYALEARPT